MFTVYLHYIAPLRGIEVSVFLLVSACENRHKALENAVLRNTFFFFNSLHSVSLFETVLIHMLTNQLQKWNNRVHFYVSIHHTADACARRVRGFLVL